MSKAKQFEELVRRISPQSELVRTWPLKGGMSAQMTALEMRQPHGRLQKLIVRQPGHGQIRQKQRRAEDEFRLLQITHSLGLATPAPYHLDQSGQILATPYLVIEYVEGEMEFCPSDLDDHLRQLATQLAQIHSVGGSTIDLSFLPETGNACAETSRRHSTAADSLLYETRIRAAVASAGPLPRGNAPTLLHGDFWPGNTLWQEGQLAAVIDWEDAKVGDPLIDLAISRSDIVWIFGTEAMDAFTHHYQSLVAIDDTNLPYWDLCAALRFIRWSGGNLAQVAASFASLGREDITERTIREKYRFFVTQALGRLTVQQ